MDREIAIEHLNNLRPSLGHETNEALDAVMEDITVKFDDSDIDDAIRAGIEIWNDCTTCLRQGCEHRQNEFIRVNCPLFKESAV